MDKSYQELVGEFDARRSSSPLSVARIYEVIGVSDKIAYNPSRRFKVFAPGLGKEVKVMYVRVESRDSDYFNCLVEPSGCYDSRAVLFYETDDGGWEQVDGRCLGLGPAGLVIDRLEDPFVAFIHGEVIVGGVRIDFSTARIVSTLIPFTAFEHFDYTKSSPTVIVTFYRGGSISELTHFATISGNREVRLLELGDGTILVATRPQGGPAGIGTIGLTTINDLGELNQEVVDGAILIKNQVAPDVKIGPNELHLLTRDGQRRDEVGVLGHVAFRDAHGDVHYSAVAFKVLNPYTFRTEGICVSPVKIIATRQNWPAGKIKRSQLRDVAFPSSLDRSNGQALLSAGLSDGEIGELLIPDPFADRR